MYTLSLNFMEKNRKKHLKSIEGIVKMYMVFLTFRLRRVD